MNDLTHLDLFAGIGGFSLAAHTAGFRTIAHSEVDPVADSVHRHFFPDSPNLGDITRIDWQRFRETHGVPLVATGGVPCQPASSLGLMRGVDDERWLWPEFIRMGRELRPPFLIAENPPSVVGLDDGRPWNGIVSELSTLRYDCWWDVFPAAAFGAGHLRERVLLICSNFESLAEWPGLCTGDTDYEVGEKARQGRPCNLRGQAAADMHGEGLQGHAGHGEGGDWRSSGAGSSLTTPDIRGRVTGSDWWHETRSGVPVLADGVSSRLVEAYSRCFGNAIVPQVAVPIFEAIKAARVKIAAA